MTPPTKDNAPVHPATQEDNIIQQMKKANQKALDLQDQVRFSSFTDEHFQSLNFYR